MPKNPLIFPDEFILDGAVSDSGIGALEVAVNSLSIASKSGAMRQANAIRVAGLGSIKNQNRGMPILNSLLPTRSVGKFTVAPSEPSGTVGYFIGGWGDVASPNFPLFAVRTDRFTFATDTIVNLGSRLNIHAASYAFGNAIAGYIGWFTSSWKLTFQSETISPIGAMLFPGRYMGASLKNQSRGYALTGTADGGSTVFGTVSRFSYAGESLVTIATVLQPRMRACAFGNRFNGYIAGGSTDATGATIHNNIERLSYASELGVIISTILPNKKTGLNGWCPGSGNASYFWGGMTSGSFPSPPTSPFRLYLINTIDRFSFAGETCSILASLLARGFCDGSVIGNAVRSVVGGGIVHLDGYTSQNVHTSEPSEIKALNYNTELHQILGCVLSLGRHLAVGLDNSTF